MTREQAIESLSWLKTRLSVGLGGMDKLSPHYKDMVGEVQSIDLAIAALRGPQPDPDTGLMPCGCGGKAVVCGSSGDDDLYTIECKNCEIDTAYYATREQAIAAWNRAMGASE